MFFTENERPKCFTKYLSNYPLDIKGQEFQLV
jgi:hypothetical protein